MSAAVARFTSAQPQLLRLLPQPFDLCQQLLVFILHLLQFAGGPQIILYHRQQLEEISCSSEASLPFGGNVVSFDLVQLILDALFGSDLRVQGRLQLQARRHVQLGETPHLPRHVLQQRTKRLKITELGFIYKCKLV